MIKRLCPIFVMLIGSCALIFVILVPMRVAAVNSGRLVDVSVTTTVDENDGCGVGDCSLREAIATAASGDRVLVPNGTYLLTLGEIAIDKTVTILGMGDVIVSGNDSSRVFNIGSSSNITLTNLTVRDGHTSGNGGAILVSGGYLTLTNALIYTNTAGKGGGLYIDNGGRVLLQSGGVVTNLATANSGAGGVHVREGKWLMNGGEVSWNVSNGGGFPGGGINVENFNATAVLNGGIIRHNDTFRGGGIMAMNGLIELNGTRIFSNVATYGGGVYLYQVAAYLIQNGGSIEQNRSVTGGSFGGGGIYSFEGSFNMNGGSIISNVTNNDGGGVYMRQSGTMSITGGTIAGNRAEGGEGGGIYAREIDGDVHNATIANNSPNGLELATLGTWVVAGNTFLDNGTAMEVYGTASLTAYANNIVSHTTAIDGSGTFWGRHNWWGEGATAVTVGDSEAFNYRLGAPVVSWSTSGQVVDSNGRQATIAATSGTGTGVIVNHGRDVAPFDKPLVPQLIAGVACADRYDFFVLNGSGGSTWDVSIPVDNSPDCNSETALPDRIYHFALSGTAPDTSCMGSACWLTYTGSVSHDASAPYTLTAEDVLLNTLGGTPFAVGNVMATAITPTVTIAKQNTTIELTWEPLDGCTHVVYRSAAPYSGFSWLGVGTSSYSDANGVGTDHFYYVEADCGGQTAVSGTVGAFNWLLEPGN